MSFWDYALLAAIGGYMAWLLFRPKKKKGKGGAGSADHDEKEAKKGDSKPNEK